VLVGTLACDVEPVGIVAPLGGVVVGGPERGEDDAALLDPPVADLEVVARDPAGELGRAVVAEQLLDRVGLERRIEAEPLELVPVPARVPLPIRLTVVSWPAM
jgi:hypothetical protein